MTETPQAESLPSSKGWQRRHTVVGAAVLALFIAYIDRVNISVAAIAMQDSLGWSETQKGFVLSSFFIGYMAAQIIGGVLADKFGGKRVLGISLILWSIFTILTPIAASIAFPALIIARIGLGLGEAPLSPAALSLFGKWVPEAERSRAVALYSSAAILGTLFALLVTGWMVAQYGWPAVFYVFGAIGLVYAVFWYTRIYEAPSDHPDVSPQERALLKANEAPAGASPKIPWGKLVSHPAVWALLVTYFCTSWSLYVFLSWMPSYFASVHSLNIMSAGLYTMAPWATMFVMMNVAGWIADKMIAQGKDLTFVRKLMQTIGLVGSGFFLYLTRYATTPEMALLSLSGALGLLAFAYSGAAPNVLDIAPRFGGVLFGIMNTLGTLPGIIGVALTGWIVDTTGSYDSVLLVAAVISIVGAGAYIMFGTAKKLIE